LQLRVCEHLIKLKRPRMQRHLAPLPSAPRSLFVRVEPSNLVPRRTADVTHHARLHVPPRLPKACHTLLVLRTTLPSQPEIRIRPCHITHAVPTAAITLLLLSLMALLLVSTFRAVPLAISSGGLRNLGMARFYPCEKERHPGIRANGIQFVSMGVVKLRRLYTNEPVKPVPRPDPVAVPCGSSAAGRRDGAGAVAGRGQCGR
jgi:hypothetical protein